MLGRKVKETMKETIIDMIMQFFGRSKHDKTLPTPVLELLTKLKDLSLDQELDGEHANEELSFNNTINVCQQSKTATRIYTLEEQYKLGNRSIRLLKFLEIKEIIDCFDRERIMQMAMGIDNKRLSLDDIKHLVLLVINEHSPSKLYMEWLSYLFFNEDTITLH